MLQRFIKIICLSQEVAFRVRAPLRKSMRTFAGQACIYGFWIHLIWQPDFLSAWCTNAGDSASKMCFDRIHRKKGRSTLGLPLCGLKQHTRIMETHAWIGPSHRVSYHAYPRLSAVGAYTNIHMYMCIGKGLGEIAKKSSSDWLCWHAPTGQTLFKLQNQFFYALYNFASLFLVLFSF